MRFSGILLTLLVLGSGAVRAQSDDTTVVTFSRHSFRGITPAIGPQQFSLPQLGMVYKLPMLSYSMECSPQGLTMAERFAREGLNQAAGKALAGAGRSGPFRGWDEIRVDLSSSRDFFTGLYFREGLKKSQTFPIQMTGCPTNEANGIDIVAIGRPIQRCIPPADLQPLRAASPNLPRLRQAAESLLSLVGEATGRSGPFDISALVDPARGAVSPIFNEIGNLASTIEMTADLGPPLKLLFPEASDTRKYDPEAVRRASNFLGVRFTAQIPIELACASSLLPLRYVNGLPAGRHVIVASHDDDVSSLCRSLETISDTGDLEDLNIYPMESIVIAINKEQASIVRLRLVLAPDGSFPGNSESRLVWHGSRAQWDEKLRKIEKRSNDWTPGAAARAEVKILTPANLDVLFQPTK